MNTTNYPSHIEIPGGIINTHTHPRDLLEDGDGRSELFIPCYQGIYADVIAIGNTKVPLTTSELAGRQKRRWQELSPLTQIHVAGLLTESTKPEDIIRGYDKPDGQEDWTAMKMFLRAVSNSGGADVDDVRTVIPCIRAMTNTAWKYKKKPMVLKVHCERKFTPVGRRIAVEDRERAAVARDIEFILQEVPEAEIEICHVSDGDTIDAVRFYQSQGYKVFAEIPPHYAEYCIDDLFEDGAGGTGVNSHLVCWPAFKSAKDRMIIESAMVSGEPWFHFGNDEACHDHDPIQETGVKVNKRGIVAGGQTQIPEEVIAFVIEKFVEAGQIDRLPDYLSNNARRLYGLPERHGSTIFEYNEHTVREELNTDLGSKILRCIVAMGYQKRLYKVAEESALI